MFFFFTMLEWLELVSIRKAYMEQVSMYGKYIGYYESLISGINMELWEKGILILSTKVDDINDAFNYAEMYQCNIINLNKDGLEGIVQKEVV